MSIQTEIVRLENAKAAIKTAIEGKGVSVPETALMDGYGEFIESIQASGGIYSGEVLFSGNSVTMETHGSDTVILAATSIDTLVDNVLSIRYTKGSGIAVAFLTTGSAATMNCEDNGTNLTIYKTGVSILGNYSWYAF
jgi:hypothetical protein